MHWMQLQLDMTGTKNLEAGIATKVPLFYLVILLENTLIIYNINCFVSIYKHSTPAKNYN